MLTRGGYAVLATGLGLLVAGLASANFYFISAALLPISAFLVAAAIENPHGIRTKVELDDFTPHVGQEIRVTVTYEIRRGFGPVEFHQPLPDLFELKPEAGTNLHVAVKGFRRKRGQWSFTMITAKRGNYQMPPVEAETVHILGLKAPTHGVVGRGFSVGVRPKPGAITQIRQMPGFARQLFPEGDLSTGGMKTNNFRDMRQYQAGDTVKMINWKATTRIPGFHDGTANPLVNEYESEGKKSVWLFLDAAPYMEVGTNVDNSFEYAIGAAHSIANFYLSKGYKLGAYVYNHGAQEVLYPDTGAKQLLRIDEVLLGLDTGNGGEGLLTALDKSKRYLIQEKPLIVIVTRLGKADETLFSALKKMRGLAGRRGRRVPVLIVSPMVHNLHPTNSSWSKDAAEIMRHLEKPQVDRARRMGARVVEWDPRSMKFESALLKGGAR